MGNYVGEKWKFDFKVVFVNYLNCVDKEWKWCSEFLYVMIFGLKVNWGWIRSVICKKSLRNILWIINCDVRSYCG